jgi:adenylate cyclase
MMKISIRVHILTIITLLVSVIVTGVIITNYYSTSSLIASSTQNIFKKNAADIESVVVNIFLPARQRLEFSAALLENGFIKPDVSPKFALFLQQLQTGIPECSLSSFANENGDYYELLKNDNGSFHDISIICTATTCTAHERNLDKDLHVIGAAKLTTWKKNDPRAVSGKFILPYDPRARPWYQETFEAKGTLLSQIYKSSYGWDATRFSTPIYNDSGRFLGIVSVQIKAAAMLDFVNKLKVTTHGVAFFFNAKRKLIVGENSKLPWVAESFQMFTQTKDTMFQYKYNNVRYLAFYDQMQHLPNHEWFLGIALPASDITSQLLQQVLISIAVTIVILLIGLVTIWFVATALSKPILQLVAEATLIKKLDFPANKRPSSRIKEIFYLQGAFNNMKESLRAFRRYVPFSVVRNLVTRGRLSKIGGEEKVLTILFSDINGFTTISEHMQPEELTSYLSTYFEVMTKDITQKYGTVDKYIGDAVMAIWGAPIEDKNHALHACECAVLMQDSLQKLNAKWGEQNLPQLKIRIGIHTGEVVVGNVGSEERLNYTVIGDNVNLASRLEGLNKLYISQIIVSEETYNLVKDHFQFRILDHVAVKGKTKGVYVYELLLDQEKFDGRLDEYKKEFNQAFRSYQKGLWDEAKQMFHHLTKEYPRDELAKIYVDRCHLFKIHPPVNWKGVWRLQ